MFIRVISLTSIYEAFVFGPVQKRISGPKKLAVQKQTGTDFEVRERADFNCLAGAGGPESIWSVVEAPKPENGTTKSPIFH